METERWKRELYHDLSPLREGMSALVQISHTAAPFWYKQGAKSAGINKPVISGFGNIRGDCSRQSAVKMRAESGTIHLPWQEAESRPSAFHSSYTEKSFSAAYCKGMALCRNETGHVCQEPSGRCSLPFSKALHHLPGWPESLPVFREARRCVKARWQRFSVSPWRGTHGHGHADTDTRAACAPPAEVRPAPGSGAILLLLPLLLLDFSSRSILPALPWFMESAFWRGAFSITTGTHGLEEAKLQSGQEKWGGEEAGAEGDGGAERTEGETGTETLQRWVSYN